MSRSYCAALSILLFLIQAAWADDNGAEPGFKNVQLFKQLSDSELSRVMNFMRSGLGVHCDFCHVVDDKGWEWENDAKPTKIKAREMIRMVMELNKTNFKGEPKISCFTCHQGRIRPNGTPPLPQDPPVFPTKTPQPATADVDSADVLRGYVEATGGDARSKILKAGSLIFKGTTDETWKRKVVPYEMRYKAPDKWIVRKTLPDGTLTYVLNGEQGWVQDAKETRPMTRSEMASVLGAVDSLKLLPELPDFKPVAVTKRTMKEREVLSLEFKRNEKDSEFFYFDPQTHLLLGRKLYTSSPVGSIPQEIHYLDYRELGGARVPFTLRADYVDPWSGGSFMFTEIVLNPPLSDDEFEMP